MSIIEHMRSEKCKMHIQLLIQARSKLMKVGFLLNFANFITIKGLSIIGMERIR